ncbi:MAG: hypothetical protein M0Q91_14910 [Methanoregula sp.]|nr:hypothetical protein [Methanoregula sp.]
MNLKLPEENLKERKPGSMRYGSGRIMFVFGNEGEREYLEYYSHHRIGGDSHVRIYSDGERISQPELSSIVCYNPDIPGDFEKENAEMEREYRETYDDLAKKGLLSAGPVPGSLLVNAHTVMKKDEQ